MNGPTDASPDPQDERLRQHPIERFAGPAHAFDLSEVAAELRSEAHPPRDGHRQMTIFQRGHITQVVFVFDEGGHLPEHRARGLVTIHVHEGRISVAAAGSDHELTAGRMLVLDPNVPHDVRAHEPSVMLLIVHMPTSDR